MSRARTLNRLARLEREHARREGLRRSRAARREPGYDPIAEWIARLVAAGLHPHEAREAVLEPEWLDLPEGTGTVTIVELAAGARATSARCASKLIASAIAHGIPPADAERLRDPATRAAVIAAAGLEPWNSPGHELRGVLETAPPRFLARYTT